MYGVLMKIGKRLSQMLRMPLKMPRKTLKTSTQRSLARIPQVLLGLS